MKILKTLIILLTLSPVMGYSQIKPLSVGDKVPDIVLSKILNYPKASTKFTEFQGKLLILDFWATWCSPCVAQIPKDDSLQKVFRGQLQILPISNERIKTVQVFLNNLKTRKGIKMPSLVEDTVLNNMFPHQYIPYFVWIGPDGKIVATTEDNQVNTTNITAVLSKQRSSIVNFSGQKGKVLNSRRPFFVSGIPIVKSPTDSIDEVEPIADSNVVFQSVVTRFIQGLPDKTSWNSTHFNASNAAILNLYQGYFGLSYKKSPLLFFSKNRYKIEVKDSLLLNKIITYTSGAQCLNWLKINGYCYELIWKKARTWDERFALLKEDLDRYFGKPLHITADIEKRMAPSDVLTLQAYSNKLTNNSGSSFERHDKFSYVQHNLPLSHFIDILQSYFWQNSDRTISDETNFKGNVDLEMHCNMNDEKAVNEQLAKYGLQFKFGIDRLTDMLIIKDRQDVQE